MKKKESVEEVEQEVYIFDAAEEDRSQISTPNELILKPRASNLLHSKFQDCPGENIRVRHMKNLFDPHLLKQNPLAKDLLETEQQLTTEYAKQHLDVDICKTPAELAELNQICEEIFIADDLDFDIGTPIENQDSAQPARQEPFKQSQGLSKQEGGEAQAAQITANSELADERVLWERPAEEMSNRQSLAKGQTDIPKSHEQSEPRINGLTIHRSLGSTTVEITNKITLLIGCIPPGVILNCKLRRSRDLLNLLSPQYDFFLENGLKHVVSAQKKILSNTEAFLISTELGNYEKSKIVATLRSNVLHNQFLILGKEQGKDVKFKFIYGAVNYGKLNKDKSQRSMSVTIPVKVSVGVRLDHIRSFSFDTLAKDQKLQCLSLCSTLHRRRSEGEKSEKNFALVDEQEEEDDYNYLRVVKQSDNLYNIEVQHPLSLLQAFGIVLTRFDAQLK